MKVKDLLERINENIKEYGEEFLDWDVYTEQVDKDDRYDKTEGENKDWEKIKDGDDWEYFMCHGFWTEFPDHKIFTINVNF